MRMLFVHRMVYQDPLGIMYLAAALRQKGHDVLFLDVKLDKNWLSKAREFSPHVVGYSVITGSQDRYLKINQKLKNHLSFISLWGGPHPTFFPEFIEEDGVDAICVGEGEEAIVELAHAIDHNQPIDSIANLHLKKDGEIIRNPLRNLCTDLDSIAFPDRTILDAYQQYRCVSSRAVIASRGCPYSCTFCFNSRLRKMYSGKGRYTRRRSVENVVDECKRFRDDPWASQILFKDDLFARNEDFVATFSEQYPKEVGLPFFCNIRADRMTEHMADNLAKAGAKVVHFGVESGSDRVRKDLLGRKISRQDMLNTARWFKQRGVGIYTFNIIGIPGESPEEAMETLEFNAELGADFAVLTLFQPYPRTPLGDKAVELGWTEPGYESFSSTYYGNSMTQMPHHRQYRNMVHLFPIAVRYPWLSRFVPSLSRLPLLRFYQPVDFIYKATRFIFTMGIVQPRDIALFSGHWKPKTPPRRSFLVNNFG